MDHLGGGGGTTTTMAKWSQGEAAAAAAWQRKVFLLVPQPSIGSDFCCHDDSVVGGDLTVLLFVG